MKLVLFDFCDTLVSLQTADAFVDYVRKQNQSKRIQLLEGVRFLLIKSRLVRLVDHLFPGSRFSKTSKLVQLRGLRMDLLDRYGSEFCQSVIMSNLIQPVYSRLKEHISAGDEVVIVSAGFRTYLKYFATSHGVKLIASEIQEEQGVCMGLMRWPDCYGAAKVCLLREQYPSLGRDAFASIIVYSDSFSDLPLLKLADSGIVVSKAKPQDWASRYGYSEIVYHDA